MTAPRRGPLRWAGALAALVTLALTACDAGGSDPISDAPIAGQSPAPDAVVPTEPTLSSGTERAPVDPTPTGLSPATVRDTRVTVTARLSQSGTLLVAERIKFASYPGFYLLSATIRNSAFGIGDDYSPELLSFRASRPGQSELTVIEDRGSYSAFYSGNTRLIDLHYELAGVAKHSSPSPYGRGLVLLTALYVDPISHLRRTIEMAGATNMGCEQPDGTIRACGRATRDGWAVQLPPHTADLSVYAQVDLNQRLQ